MAVQDWENPPTGVAQDRKSDETLHVAGKFGVATEDQFDELVPPRSERVRVVWRAGNLRTERSWVVRLERPGFEADDAAGGVYDLQVRVQSPRVHTHLWLRPREYQHVAQSGGAARTSRVGLDLPVGSGCGLSYLVQLGWHAPSPARSSRREFGEFAIRGRRLFEDAAGCLFRQRGSPDVLEVLSPYGSVPKDPPLPLGDILGPAAVLGGEALAISYAIGPVQGR